MELEEITGKLEEEREKWLRKERMPKAKEIKFYQHDIIKRYVANALLGIAAAAICFYIEYRITNSGSKIIERHIDDLSGFYLEE
jgi:hypothetical protein